MNEESIINFALFLFLLALAIYIPTLISTFDSNFTALLQFVFGFMGLYFLSRVFT
jgi:hypothetical protein